eukprot:TRINITY_DN7454_c4_g2_i1.p1 TRINITY_DN7454_c4_g2~~TRINITY_DN7454_c4_g2_i1.p1  ORF type:complete len:143 (+),score=16.33 TRINITY_DN7454_c4_g2_i1:167-595(+)
MRCCALHGGSVSRRQPKMYWYSACDMCKLGSQDESEVNRPRSLGTVAAAEREREREREREMLVALNCFSASTIPRTSACEGLTPTKSSGRPIVQIRLFLVTSIVALNPSSFREVDPASKPSSAAARHARSHAAKQRRNHAYD